MKKIISFILISVLVLSLGIISFAENDTKSAAEYENGFYSDVNLEIEQEFGGIYLCEASTGKVLYASGEFKAASLPAVSSARATEESFPLAITVLLIRSSTVIRSPSSRKTWLPPIDAALALTLTVSVSLNFPASSASQTSSKVITLVTEAGDVALNSLVA